MRHVPQIIRSATGVQPREIGVPRREWAISEPDEADIVAYLSALLRMANGTPHELKRSSLFGLFDAYLAANIAAIRSAEMIAAEFGISERTFHRIFADRDTTFERHVQQLRVGLFRKLLCNPSQREASIARLAAQCGFADAAHATRTFRSAFGTTPREFKSATLGAASQVEERIAIALR